MIVLPAPGSSASRKRRLDQKPQLFRIRRTCRGGVFRTLSGGENDRGLFGGNDRLFERAVGQSDAAFVTSGAVNAERPHVLQDDGYVEVPRQGNSASELR